MNIKQNIKNVQQTIQTCQHDLERVRIVAATKYADIKQMEELYEGGITIMGKIVSTLFLKKKIN